MSIVKCFRRIFHRTERSRNVIGHTNVLSDEEVVRLEMHVRDWVRQVRKSDPSFQRTAFGYPWTLTSRNSGAGLKYSADTL